MSAGDEDSSVEATGHHDGQPTLRKLFLEAAESVCIEGFKGKPSSANAGDCIKTLTNGPSLGIGTLVASPRGTAARGCSMDVRGFSALVTADLFMTERSTIRMPINEALPSSPLESSWHCSWGPMRLTLCHSPLPLKAGPRSSC